MESEDRDVIRPPHALHELLFNVRRSIRYHNRRRYFFDQIHVISTILSALSGSATIAAVLGNLGTTWTVGFAAAVAIFSAVDVVVGTDRAAKTYHELAKRFIDLEKAIITSDDITDKDIARFTAQRLEIEADEPPALKVLDSICYNEMLRAMGYPESEYVTIKWYQRIFAQIIDIREHSVKKTCA